MPEEEMDEECNGCGYGTTNLEFFKSNGPRDGGGGEWLCPFCAVSVIHMHSRYGSPSDMRDVGVDMSSMLNVLLEKLK